MIYTFESPIVLTAEDGSSISPNQDMVNAINERLVADGCDLAEFLHEDLDMVVASITMESRLGMQGITCRTTCKADALLPPGLMNHLSTFITGQFSDGWGEGFEQNAFTTCGKDFYASFWWSDNWLLDVVGFSKEN